MSIFFIDKVRDCSTGQLLIAKYSIHVAWTRDLFLLSLLLFLSLSLFINLGIYLSLSVTNGTYNYELPYALAFVIGANAGENRTGGSSGFP